MTINRAKGATLNLNIDSLEIHSMATIMFDTLKFAQRLEQSGVPRNQAELATKNDIKDIRNDIQAIRLKMVEQDGQFVLLKWMIGFLIAGILSLVIKAFL